MRQTDKGDYYIACGFAFCMLFAAMLFFAWQTYKQPWCKPDEIECFREWVSARGG